MESLFPRLFKNSRKDSSYEQDIRSYICEQLGRKPKHIGLYVQAMTHSSYKSGGDQHFSHVNERLEYLGDAVLDLCVADVLFKAYPTVDEGVLTNIRSNIVNTAHLAQLAIKISLTRLLRYRGSPPPSQNVIGDALEAFIGAVYLDQGYEVCFDFIKRRLLWPHVSLEMMRTQTFNYKGKIVEWAQQEKRLLHFDNIAVKNASSPKKMQTTLYLDEEEMAQTTATNKKEAQQLAAKIACLRLNIP